MIAITMDLDTAVTKMTSLTPSQGMRTLTLSGTSILINVLMTMMRVNHRSR